jgi:hypothetical protein
MTWLPRSPGSTLVLRLNQEIVHYFILLFIPPCGLHMTMLPPGPSNEAYLSSPHLEASPAMTFRACSSPAPTPVKSQPAPTLLSQESVHRTLSITHHTRKGPSPGPRTTHGPHTCAAGDVDVRVASASAISGCRELNFRRCYHRHHRRRDYLQRCHDCRQHCHGCCHPTSVLQLRP